MHRHRRITRPNEPSSSRETTSRDVRGTWRRLWGHLRAPNFFALVSLLSLGAPATAQQPPASSPRIEARTRAVEACRDGHVDEGLESLRVLHVADPSDRETLATYVIELSRAGRHEQVAQFIPQLDLARGSDPLLEAVARSLHEVGRVSEGDDVWSRIEQRRFRDEERERAVGLARKGRHQESLTILRLLHDSAPEDARVLGDYVVVSNWAGNDADAVRLGADVDRTTAPTYVLEAYGRALRNERRYAEAADVYRGVVERIPERWEARLGLAYALAESEQDEDARVQLELLAAEQPFNTDVLLGRATIHRWIGEPFAALAVLDELERLKPDDAVAHRLRVHTMVDLGAIHAAIAEAERKPDAMTPADWELLNGRRASEFVTWGTVSATDPATPVNDSDRALGIVDELLANAGDPAVRAQARSNRLIAWRDRGRMRDVVRAYEADEEARVDPATLTPLALTAVADAYTSERRPERAIELYRRALVSLREPSPDRYRAVVGLFYALLRAEEYDEAAQCMDELAAAEPAWLTSFGGAPRENPYKLGADRHVNTLLAWSDRLDEAGDVLEQRVDRAPYNADLRADLAEVDLGRDWPTQALEQARMASSVEPAHTGARIALAHAYLARREYPEADQEIRALTLAQPDNALVHELREEWNVHDRWELDGSLGFGKSSNSGIFGDRDYGAEFTLFTRPLDYHTRAFVHGLASVGEFDEGIPRFERFGIGLEHERWYWNARGEVHASWQRESTGIESSLGFDLGAGLTPDDHWSLGAKFESDTLQQPMRARLDGVDGKRYAVEVDYSFSDRTKLSFELDRIDMSDDNRREYGVLSLAQRLITTAHYKLTLSPQIYASRNSLDPADAVYFDPAHDFEVGFDATNEWIGSRRYERSLTHRLIVSLASYDQHEFAPELTGGLRYEQELRLSRYTGYTYGIGLSSYAFDGEREQRVWLYLQPNWRF